MIKHTNVPAELGEAAMTACTEWLATQSEAVCTAAAYCCEGAGFVCLLGPAVLLLPPPEVRPRPRPRPLLPCCWRGPTNCGGKKCGACEDGLQRRETSAANTLKDWARESGHRQCGQDSTQAHSTGVLQPEHAPARHVGGEACTIDGRVAAVLLSKPAMGLLLRLRLLLLLLLLLRVTRAAGTAAPAGKAAAAGRLHMRV